MSRGTVPAPRARSGKVRLLSFGVALLASALNSIPIPAFAAFEDVSLTSGVSLTDHTYGLAWGDFDLDNDPDLLVGRHFYRPVIYRNVGDGTFAFFFTPPLFDSSDHHGPLVADFDEDGDMDIYMTSGADGGTGTVPKFLYRNDGGFDFVDIATESGLTDVLGRGRSSSAMDVDGDGALDIFVAKAPRPISANSLFHNDGTGHFVDIAASAGVADTFGSVGAVWGDYDGDRDPDLLIGGEEGGGSYETRLYRNEGNLTFANVTTEALPGIPKITAADWGDYDADGDLDLAIGFGDEAYFDAVVWSADSLRFFFNARSTDNGLDGFAFTQSGDTTAYDLYTNGFYQPSTVYISEDAYNPGPSAPFKLPFAIHGAPPFAPGQSVGIYVWTDSLFGIWQVRCNTPPAAGNTFAGVLVANGDFTAVSTTEIEGYEHGGRGPRIFRNDGGIFLDLTPDTGITNSGNVRQLGWVDLDLDGNLDLFVMNKGDTEIMNGPDVFYRNLGGGSFEDATAAQNLSGDTQGLGDAFSFEDFDSDGDLDLSEVNGAGPRFFAVHTPHRLYRNDGPTGNPLRVDLEGVLSTKDGYGAWVTCVSASTGRQVRYVTGNSWRGGHVMLEQVFGLGPDATADTLKVVWPSTAITILTDVPFGRVTVNETEPMTDVSSLAPPREILRVRVSPNPARGAAVFSIEGRGRTPAKLEIFDPAGRLLESRSLADLARTVSWNGVARNGTRAAAGVYFARVKEGSRTALAKFVLTRP